jgi:SAM-dependent methyltransferase
MNKQRPPSNRDLAIWAKVNEDLLDKLYTGLPGRLQAIGHRLIDGWAKSYADQVVVEIGCGHGHHLRYAQNTYRHYLGLEIELKFLRTLRARFPATAVVNGDTYRLPFRDQSVGCLLSVYCFEHLRNLPACLAEIRRVLHPEGELLVGLPAEGGLLYGLGRKFTSKRYMERKYGIDYDAIVKWEHCNTAPDVIRAVREQFTIQERRFLPFSLIPTLHVNAIVCLRCRPQ